MTSTHPHSAILLRSFEFGVWNKKTELTKCGKRIILITVVSKMLTKTLRVENSFIALPELEKYKGKLVEIIVREKKESKKKKLDKFFSLCGKVSLDGSEIDKLREASYI